MAKAPRIGAGKQRLAADIGRVEAWRVNRALHAHTLRVATDTRWRTLLCVAPRAALHLGLPGVWPSNTLRTLQSDGDLGARMAHAMTPHRNVAIIGTDAPQLTKALIARAFQSLASAPFVMGPSEDGGFWLLAARDGRAAARAMHPVRWSSEQAMADVLRNLDSKVVRLPTLHDIDDVNDLRALRR